MWYNGKMTKLWSIFLGLAFAATTSAHFNQLPLSGEPAPETSSSTTKPNPHLQGWQGSELVDEKPRRRLGRQSNHVRSTDPLPDQLPANPKLGSMASGATLPGEGSRMEGFVGMNGNEIVKNINRKGRHSIGFRYFKDDYDYFNDSNSFAKTFQEGSGSVQGGYLHFGGDRYFMRKYIDLAFYAQVGVGYNKGTGAFVDGARSVSRIQLWLLPLDAGLSIGIPIWRLAVLKFDGGPSLMGAIQTRGDRDRGDSTREKRQVSPGTFAQASLRFNLSQIFPRTGFGAYRSYNASNYYLDFTVRDHRYNRFKDQDLEISGQSIGAGLSFEFL
jgi:hypothetical protein